MGALKPRTAFRAAPPELVPHREPFPINMPLLIELSPLQYPGSGLCFRSGFQRKWRGRLRARISRNEQGRSVCA